MMKAALASTAGRPARLNEFEQRDHSVQATLIVRLPNWNLAENTQLLEQAASLGFTSAAIDLPAGAVGPELRAQVQPLAAACRALSLEIVLCLDAGSESSDTARVRQMLTSCSTELGVDRVCVPWLTYDSTSSLDAVVSRQSAPQYAFELLVATGNDNSPRQAASHLAFTRCKFAAHLLLPVAAMVTFSGPALSHFLAAPELMAYWRRLTVLRQRLLPGLQRADYQSVEDGDAFCFHYRSHSGEFLVLVHSGDCDTPMILNLPRGSWRRILDSSEPQWGGPGSITRTELFSSGTVRLNVRAHTGYAFERVAEAYT